MATMRSKRRRVYSFNTNTIAYTTFYHQYMAYLLPALFNATSTVNKSTEQIQKIVRHEVDMALVSSTDEFKWSRALRHKLEQGAKIKKLEIELNAHSTGKLKAFPYIPRSIMLVEETRPRKATQRRIEKRGLKEKEELDRQIRVLRRILPGMGEMSVCELLSELESYVVCLQLQVDVLRSLVGAQ